MQRLTTWDVRVCTPTMVAAERVGYECGERIDVNVSKPMDFPKNNVRRSRVELRQDIFWR